MYGSRGCSYAVSALPLQAWRRQGVALAETGTALHAHPDGVRGVLVNGRPGAKQRGQSESAEVKECDATRKGGHSFDMFRMALASNQFPPGGSSC